MTGFSNGSGTRYDYATLGYDATTGTKLWVKRYDDPANGRDFAFALGVSPAGSPTVDPCSPMPRGPRYTTVVLVSYPLRTRAFA